MKEICKGIGNAYGATIKLNYKDGYPPVINDKVITDNVKNAAYKIVPNGIVKPYLSMGGEDFSYFANIIPGCFFFLGSLPKDRAPMSTPQHCSHYDINEEVMLIGSSIFIELGLNI